MPSLAAQSELLICPLEDRRLRVTDYLGVLSDDERRRVALMRRPEARRRSVVARVLLRLELAQRLGCPPETVHLVTGAEGKPALASDDSWHFNLAHAGERVVLALAPNAPVGVDIESRLRRSRFDALARNYFNPEEVAELAALDAAARRSHFLRLWTVKEAVTKALGRSLWGTLAGITLTAGGRGTPELRLEGGAQCDRPMAWWQWQLDDHYSLAFVRLSRDGGAPVASWVIPGELREALSLPAPLSGVRPPLGVCAGWL